MTNFSIRSTPLQVVGQGVDTSPLTVQNTGSVSIYISGDPGVSPNAYEYKIDAGGDFIWPPGKPLSVCTGPNLTGQISFGGTGDVHVNSGSTNVTGAVTINGSVPISGPVTVSGTVALTAGSTVAISGPVAISGTVPISGNVNIAGGTVGLSGPVSITGGVSVTGSTINVGAPVTLSHNVTAIGSFSMLISVGVTALAIQGPYNVAPYSSIIIKLYNNATTYAPAANNWLDIFITTIGGSGNQYIHPQFLATTGATQYIQFPVTGASIMINVTTHINAFNAGNFSFAILGSGESLNTYKYVSGGDGMLGDIAQSGFFGLHALAASSGILSTRNGEAVVTMYSNSTTVQSQLVLQILDSGNPVEIYSGLPSTASAGNLIVPNIIKFPLRPIQYYVSGNAGMNASVAIVQEG